jgi:cyanate permease
MVTLYYLFRVASAWLLIVWLTTILRQRGMPPDEAGFVLSLATICQIPFALAAGVLTRWLGGLGSLMTTATLVAIAACWGLLVAPLNLWVPFAMLLGFGMGSIFALGMTLIATTEPDEAGTIALSGLAQGVGFIGGGLLAWAAMLGLKKLLSREQIWLCSPVAAVFHNIGQLLVAAAVMKTWAVMAYLPYLLLAGIAAGLFTGLCAQFLIRRLERVAN